MAKYIFNLFKTYPTSLLYLSFSGTLRTSIELIYLIFFFCSIQGLEPILYYFFVPPPHLHKLPLRSLQSQTIGDFLNFNLHLHIIATDGCFINDGIFVNGIIPIASDLEIPFRNEVHEMIKREGKITNTIIDNKVSWQHKSI